MSGVVERSSAILRQAWSTVVWSRPPKASPMSGRLERRQFLGQRHGDLARARDHARALLRIHLRDLDLVVVGHGLLDVLDGDLSGLHGEQILQGVARGFDA